MHGVFVLTSNVLFQAYVVSGETVVSDDSQDELEEEATHSEHGKFKILV